NQDTTEQRSAGGITAAATSAAQTTTPVVPATPTATPVVPAAPPKLHTTGGAAPLPVVGALALSGLVITGIGWALGWRLQKGPVRDVVP
ncbi:MAG: hypothetical protein HW403_560, partial [Dehalococcoidia bacterium]|nr:hypothetical protein [Dehalococcoidia bacterium]